jgi:hypothetical protein
VPRAPRPGDALINPAWRPLKFSHLPTISIQAEADISVNPTSLARNVALDRHG